MPAGELDPDRFAKFFSGDREVKMVSLIDHEGGMSEILGLMTKELLFESRRMLVGHQFRMLSEIGGLSDKILSELVDEHGYNLQAYPIDQEILIPRWIRAYLIENVFGPFLQFGEQLRFDSDYYARGWAHNRIPEDATIDVFLTREKTFQPQQVAFFHQQPEGEGEHLATDLRFHHLNNGQRKDLLGSVNEYLTGINYSEVVYRGVYNPFYEAIYRLLQAAMVLDPEFEHPFVGETKVHFSPGNDYVPSGLWGWNPIMEADPLFLGDRVFEDGVDQFPDGTKARIIGATASDGYFSTGLLVAKVE